MKIYFYGVKVYWSIRLETRFDCVDLQRVWVSDSCDRRGGGKRADKKYEGVLSFHRRFIPSKLKSTERVLINALYPHTAAHAALRATKLFVIPDSLHITQRTSTSTQNLFLPDKTI